MRITPASIALCIYVPLAVPLSIQASSETLLLEYDSWKIWYNCERRGYDAFHYTTVPDSGRLPRYNTFRHEEAMPEHCRQTSTSSYSVTEGSDIRYDRGHGVHQNIWDHDRDLMVASNSMANIVPQASRLNRWGVWRHTEKLTECWRDHGTVEVWGGVVWGNDTSNDHFTESHGVHTPDLLWKVVQYPDGEVNAWLMPNDDTPDDDNIDDYLTHSDVITALLDFQLPFNIDSEVINTATTREMPEGCSLE